MTPAIELLRSARIAHQIHAYEHVRSTRAFGHEAVEQLGLDARQVFKTLLVSTDRNELLVAIVAVADQLDLKALALASDCRHCAMAAVTRAQRATGYLVGGISPLGQKKKLRTFIDARAQALPQIYVSAGRRGLEVALSPADLARLTEACFAPIARA